MARVKSIAARRHRKILKQAKGFTQARRRRVRAAKEALMHAGAYAYVGRKLRKRDLRSLWTMRINAAVRPEGLSYSRFISALKKSDVQLDRKMLSEIAATDIETFKQIVNQVK